MKKITQIGMLELSSPEFWFEWGDEPSGYVTVGKYINGEVKLIGHTPKEFVAELEIIFSNPYP